MTQRDKNRIASLIDQAVANAKDESDYLTGLDNDCEEVSVECVTMEAFLRLMDGLKAQLLEEGDEGDKDGKLKVCPVCGSPLVEAVVKPGSWGYYPVSAHIECKACGTRSREYDGKDDCDRDGAILKATKAWNRGRAD